MSSIDNALVNGLDICISTKSIEPDSTRDLAICGGSVKLVVT